MAEMRSYRVGKSGAYHALRSEARRIREALQAATVQGDTIVLDFAGVEAITGAFADELMASLVTDRHVVTRNANEDVQETLTTVLARRGLPPVTTTEQTGDGNAAGS